MSYDDDYGIHSNVHRFIIGFTVHQSVSDGWADSVVGRPVCVVQKKCLRLLVQGMT